MSNVNLHEQKDLPFKTDINMPLIMQFKKRKKKSQFSWREGAIIAQDKVVGHDRLNPVFDIRESKY